MDLKEINPDCHPDLYPAIDKIDGELAEGAIAMRVLRRYLRRLNLALEFYAERGGTTSIATDKAIIECALESLYVQQRQAATRLAKVIDNGYVPGDQLRTDEEMEEMDATVRRKAEVS